MQTNALASRSRRSRRRTRRGQIKLADFSARAGDSFAGHLLELLGSRNSPARAREFRVVFASHVLYHCEHPGSAERLIDDVTQNVLADEGIFILYHLAKVPQSFQDFRARYGSNSADVARSNTPAVAIDDPPAKVAEVCAARGVPCLGMDFTADLRFAIPDEKVWNLYRDPQKYAQLPADAAEDLNRLMFITQRAPIEFAADHSSTGLSAYLDEIGDVILRNGGILKLAEAMQVSIARERGGSGQTDRRGAVRNTDRSLGGAKRQWTDGRAARREHAVCCSDRVVVRERHYLDPRGAMLE